MVIEISKNRFINAIQLDGVYILYGLRKAPTEEMPKSFERNCVTLDGVKYVNEPLNGSGGQSISKDELADMKKKGKISKGYWPRKLTLSPADQKAVLALL